MRVKTGKGIGPGLNQKLASPVGIEAVAPVTWNVFFGNLLCVVQDNVGRASRGYHEPVRTDKYVPDVEQLFPVERTRDQACFLKLRNQFARAMQKIVIDVAAEQLVQNLFAAFRAPAAGVFDHDPGVFLSKRREKFLDILLVRVGRADSHLALFPGERDDFIQTIAKPLDGSTGDIDKAGDSKKGQEGCRPKKPPCFDFTHVALRFSIGRFRTTHAAFGCGTSSGQFAITTGSGGKPSTFK